MADSFILPYETRVITEVGVTGIEPARPKDTRS